MEAVVESINKKLTENPVNKVLKKKTKKYLPYLKNTTIIPKQTMMSPMLNGQLKTGYNIQIGFTFYPNPTDTKTMIPPFKPSGRKVEKIF